MQKTKITIKNMSCGGCKMKVKSLFEEAGYNDIKYVDADSSYLVNFEEGNFQKLRELFSKSPYEIGKVFI